MHIPSSQACYKPGRYASIDIGTVTSRMLVADLDAHGEFTELAREYAITNLGEGVDATGVLKPEAIQRVADAVRRFLDVLAALQREDSESKPVVLRACSTSAARDAANAQEFIGALAQLGVMLEVIPGECEAALSFAGASSGFAGQRIAVVDVGGGSTEIIVGEAGGSAESVKAHSFDIGCRRVTERFLHSDPPSAQELKEAQEWIRGQFAPYCAALKADALMGDVLIAVAGTATSVVSMRDEMAVYDSARVHHAHVSRECLSEMLERLAAMTESQRRHIVGLDPDRAPVIVAGLLILLEALDAGGFDEFVASETDVLHGIILDAARI